MKTPRLGPIARLLVLTATLALPLAATTVAADPAKPNIVFIMADDPGY